MEFAPKFFGKVQDGKLALDDEREFKAYLHSLSGIVEVIVRRWRKKRTDRQNRFYRAYLHLISQESGHTEDELHEAFKQRFIQGETKEIFGKEVGVKSTTKLTKQEFTEYLDRIALLTGVPVPDPDKVTAE